MAKCDWNTFRNYVAFLAGELAPGTRRPHHDCELSSCYHDAFLPWGHYHNNIVLFYHNSPITRSHFMDPTDHGIKGFYCNSIANALELRLSCTDPSIWCWRYWCQAMMLTKFYVHAIWHHLRPMRSWQRNMSYKFVFRYVHKCTKNDPTFLYTVILLFS